MARDFHGHPLCRHESYEVCTRWWCTYRLLAGMCALMLGPAVASFTVPASWAPGVAVTVLAALVWAVVAVPRWVADATRL